MSRSTPAAGRRSEPPPWCLDWTVPAEQVVDQPRDVARTADISERALLATAFGVLSVEALATTGVIKPRGTGRLRLTGRATATLRQACVVTLEPVEQSIDEPFEIEFWPPDQIAPETRPEVEIDPDNTPEPLDAEGVPYGRIVYETIATAIDLYPRAPGASLELPPEPEAARANPFAMLAKLKGKRPEPDQGT